MLSTRYFVLLALLTLTGCPTRNADPSMDGSSGVAASGGTAGKGSNGFVDAGAGGAGSESAKLSSPDGSSSKSGGKPIADGCAANSECASGFCVDSVCCNTACDGQCSTCNISGNVGYCTAQTAGDDTTSAETCTGAHTCALGPPLINLPACRLKNLQACKADSDCASLLCATFYVDHDGDGYGESNKTLQLCEDTGAAPPTGYVAQGGDCCDSDASAFPGQMKYFVSPDACGSYDYNCDGTYEGALGGLTYATVPLSDCGMEESGGCDSCTETILCR